MNIGNRLTCLLLLALLVLSSSTKLFAGENPKANLNQLTTNLPIFGFCWHPNGQEILFSSRDWIYSVDVNNVRIRKLIPGRCPQWIEAGKRFIYFLDVGYDGDRCELWSADRNGGARLRVCQKDFFIQAEPSPAVSPNGSMIAFHYSHGMRARRFREIRLILFGVYGGPSTRIIHIAPNTSELHIIGWIDNSHLAITRNGRVLLLDLEQIEWAPVDSGFTSERFVRLKTSSVGVTETSYHELIRTGKIPYNCEISQDGQWAAQVEHVEGKGPYRNKLIMRKLIAQEESFLVCENVSPPRFYGLPRFAPADLKIAFIKWCGDPRHYYGDLWLVDLAEIEAKPEISLEKIVKVGD